MILAAGLGLRMRPLTETTPKPLIPVAGRPLIAYARDTLYEAGIGHTVVNAHYLADQVAAYFAAAPDVRVVRETALLETGGGIAHALAHLGGGPFFALNSDTICLSGREPALRRMAAAWDGQRMDLLLLLHPVARAIGYDGQGDFVRDAATGRFRRRRDDEAGDLVFTGVQLLHPRLFAGCPEGPFSMNDLYNARAGKGGWFERIGYLVHDGDWLHVGDAAGLAAAEAFLARRAVPA